MEPRLSLVVPDATNVVSGTFFRDKAEENQAHKSACLQAKFDVRRFDEQRERENRRFSSRLWSYEKGFIIKFIEKERVQ